jgi:hypothetical protein
MYVKSPNNTSKWQMELNSAFKGLIITGVPIARRSIKGYLRVTSWKSQSYFQHLVESNVGTASDSCPDHTESESDDM